MLHSQETCEAHINDNGNTSSYGEGGIKPPELRSDGVAAIVYLSPTSGFDLHGRLTRGEGVGRGEDLPGDLIPGFVRYQFRGLKGFAQGEGGWAPILLSQAFPLIVFAAPKPTEIDL